MVQALVDLLARRDPATLDVLVERFPEKGTLLSAGKTLGGNDQSTDALLRELALATVKFVQNECDSVLIDVRRRLQTSARVRIAGMITSSISSAGLLTALLKNAADLALATGVIAFLASTLTAVSQYHEEYAGRKTSLHDYRDKTLDLAKAGAEIAGELRLMVATGRFAEIESYVRRLNVAAAEIRQIQLALN